ncbi:hypothetical protein D3C73_1281830 [compost metagenome]
MERQLHRLEPFRFIESQRRTFYLKSTGYRIVMQAEAIHMPGGFTHQRLRPVIVVDVGSAGNFINAILAVISHIGLEPAVFIRVILCPHVAATTPVLISYPEIFQLPGLLPAVRLPPVRHR